MERKKGREVRGGTWRRAETNIVARDCELTSVVAARERCVPGGERGSFEDHGEGDPDVLVSPARRGTKASMCVPHRESSSLAGLASQVGQVPFAPRIPRSLVLRSRKTEPSILDARIRTQCVRLRNRSGRIVVCLRRSNVIARACLKMMGKGGGGGGEGRESGGGGGEIEKVRIIGWCESKKRRVMESNADEQRASSG